MQTDYDPENYTRDDYLNIWNGLSDRERRYAIEMHGLTLKGYDKWTDREKTRYLSLSSWEESKGIHAILLPISNMTEEENLFLHKVIDA